jgi:hypothetical protein
MYYKKQKSFINVLQEVNMLDLFLWIMLYSFSLNFSFQILLLCRFDEKNILIIELLQVAIIFKGYPDILEEFTNFLPKAYSNYFSTQTFVHRDI